MDYYRPLLYGGLNVLSSCGIVFVNKMVFQMFKFHFAYSLTLLHTLTTMMGMTLFLRLGFFEKKVLSKAAIVPLAAAYVGYIVLSNLNLKINTVSFYQITKIAVAPAVLAIEWIAFGKQQSKEVVASIVLVCIGVGLSTMSDLQLGTSSVGFLVGCGSIAVTSLYLIWAGSKQKELGAGSMQLLDQYCPIAAGMLTILIPIMEPVGFKGATPDTLLGYKFTPTACAVIAVSALLGLLVSLSAFLTIGATSSLTYNVVGHVKTVIVLTGGCLFFGDEMPIKKLAGLSLSMGGIIWYTHVKMTQAKNSASQTEETSPLKSNLLLKGAGKAEESP